MSSAVVTDQKPFSAGNSGIFSVQWIGHSTRMRLNASCGGPSSHSSSSVISTLRMSLPTVAMKTSGIVSPNAPPMLLATQPVGGAGGLEALDLERADLEPADRERVEHDLPAVGPSDRQLPDGGPADRKPPDRDRSQGER